MTDLQSGPLKPFLDLVHGDDSLCMEIRDNYINIYYRGGSLYKISPSPQKAGKYNVSFDNKYTLLHTNQVSAILPNDLDAWLRSLPILKFEMDAWFNRHPKLEREIQQQIVRENNQIRLARHTDYFITDIELAGLQSGSRFDMTAIKWLSEPGPRKSKKGIIPAYIEVKFGDNSLFGKAGLEKHIRDMASLLCDPLKLHTSVTEIQSLFNQKIQLQLIKGATGSISIDTSAKPEVILILANHKPASTILKREIEKILTLQEYKDLNQVCDVRVACSSFMGYGLYARCMVSLEDCLRLLEGNLVGGCK